MRCPNCQTEVRDGAAFCGSCGAAIPQGAPAGTEQPTAPMTPPAAAAPAGAAVDQAQAEYERQMAEYRAKQAEYERQKAAYDQQQAPYQQPTQVMPPAQGQPGYAQPGYVQPPPPPKKKTGLVIGIVAAVVVVLIGLVVGGILIARNLADDAIQDLEASIEQPVVEEATGEETEADAGGAAAPSGYATADEAVAAALAEDDAGDWVYQIYDEDGDTITYWAGPPNSEWVSEITVQRGPDGSWTVTGAAPLEFGGDVPMSAGDEAAFIVLEFLTAVQQDRAEDAHGFTVEPFSLDPASASYSNGELTAFEVLAVEEQSDGTVWVTTSETWYGNTESWSYYVVPTEIGYRISSLEPA
ncbi:zinc ribbon domain-containing protein [Anaerosoma tenue]|uniref:zinc ribbon domain-containing protein n=1 Tax=Anaerosoma tenue TaxID=2933588 RepID=UPI002260AE16|nr:zinc ribbon domain-containing protein [Anaerosoma tenue]MCK8115883.1 zinc ribbon domain-containing protein [Anaerosoma tenue]